MNTPLMKKVDCIQLYVADLDEGLAFYRDELGHRLIWRSETAAGLQLPENDTELVLQTERREMEIDFQVDSVGAAVERFVAAGGTVIVPPFDIQIGRAAVVQDRWDNRFILLDASKGLLLTDDEGRILGNQPVDGSG